MNTATDNPSGSILVWDLPVRVFHWALVASFAVAYLTAESEQGIAHFVSGYLFAALIAFRLVWGLLGSRYARFVEFIRAPGAVVGYLRGYVSGGVQRYIGHNPAGAVAILLMLALGLALVVTGWLNLTGPEIEALEESHELVADAMLAVIAVHIVGVIVSSRMHRENLARSMITGFKPGDAAAAIPKRHGLVALLLVLALGIFGWGLAQGLFPVLLDPARLAAMDHGEHGHGGDAAGD